jgi:outer membrane immunogenic protein
MASHGVVGLSMKKLLLAGLATLALALPAMAADLGPPVPEPAYKAPYVMAPAYDWTGFYIGGFGSYSWTSTNSTTANTATGAVFPSVTDQRSAGHGGGQIGFDYMMDSRIVIGVVADISSGETNSSTTIDAAETHTNQTTTFESGTLRARFGYAFDRVLLYGTGGWRWSNGQASRTQVTGTVGNAVPGTLDSGNTDVSGWTVGGGVAFAFARYWNVFAEYRYAAAGSDVTFPLAQRSVNAFSEVNAVLVGLNLKLDGNPIGCAWYQQSC